MDIYVKRRFVTIKQSWDDMLHDILLFMIYKTMCRLQLM